MAGKQKSLEETFEESFKTLPELSEKTRRVFVYLFPWIAIVLGVIGISLVLLSFGFLKVTSFSLIGKNLPMLALFLSGGVLGLLGSLLTLLSVPGLFKRKKSGWQRLFWSQIVGVVGSLISFTFFGLIVIAIIIYLLFQVKNYYREG